jgi:UDP-N-acetylmuramate dehydrogenase
MKDNPHPPFYNSLQKYLDEQHITTFTPQVIRDAVIAVRQSKLPDPAQVANNGSFFANPVVDRGTLVQLQATFPDIVSWETSDGGVKLSAAWLVEQAGFKGVHDAETGMATWPAQALVLVNEHAQTTADLLKFKQKIVDTVQAKFGVTLEQEPELLGQ